MSSTVPLPNKLAPFGSSWTFPSQQSIHHIRNFVVESRLPTKMASVERGIAGGIPAGSEGLFADIAGFFVPHVVLIVGVLTMSSSSNLSCGSWPIPMMLYLSVSLGIVSATHWRFK
jgi:hypothetical protein